MRQLDIELDLLKSDLIKMASLAENAIGKAVHAHLLREVEPAEDVLRSDRAIDRLELEIDERCLQLLARYQPEASDLRLIAMALKINNDLERIGDQAVNIAERTLELLKEPVLKPSIDIPHMAQMVQSMLKQSVDAFVHGDAQSAKSVCLQDAAIDRLDDQIFRVLLTHMMEDRTMISRALQLLLVSRHLERVGDHATNIAEHVIYLIDGQNLKRRWLEELQPTEA